jgi:type II secretory pathway component GspD/PulD (secretin)
MKKLSPILLAGLTAGWFATTAIVAAQTNDAAPPDQTPADQTPADQATPPPANQETPGQSGDQNATAQSSDQTNATPAVAAEPATPPALGTNTALTAGTAEKGLILNFHGVPVDTVLNYLSTAAGFVIMRDADTRSGGTVDMQSPTPVSKDEIIGLLNKVLAKNDLTAIQDGRTLTIMTLEAAKSNAGTPVHEWNDDWTSIPQDATVSTWILPLHQLNPTQVAKDLSPLRPPGAELNANEGGNALIMTGRGSDVRRFAQILQALDKSGNGDLEVFLLTYADSKSIAQELKDVFTSQDTTAQNPFQAMFGRRGGGGFGGPGGGGTSAEDNAKRATVHVNAVSDDQNNAVIVSAPADFMPGISNLIVKLDIPQEDTVQITVFALKHADCTEVANELTSLFPDPSLQNQQNNGRRGFGQFVGFGGFGGGNRGATSTLSDRMKKQTTVLAVPDPRTQSVIVTASKDTMVQIKAMIEELDANPAGAKRVFVFHPMNGDAADFQAPLKDLFMSTSSSSSSTQVNALQSRAQQAAQQQTTSSSSGFGTSSGGGGGTSGLR